MNDLKLFFSISYGTLPWQPILWAKSTCNTDLVVSMTFARVAPPAYDKKGSFATQIAGKQITYSMDTDKTIN